MDERGIVLWGPPHLIHMVPFLPSSTSMGHLPPPPFLFFHPAYFFQGRLVRHAVKRTRGALMQQCPEFLTFALVARAGRKFPSPSPPSSPPILCSTCCIFPFFGPPLLSSLLP